MKRRVISENVLEESTLGNSDQLPCFSYSETVSCLPLPIGENRPSHSSTGSDHSSRSSKAKLFGIEFSDLHVSKEDSVKPWCHRLESQLFEAEYLADEYSCLVPTDVSTIVHPSQKKSLRVVELRQLARESDGARLVETRWNLVVQPFVRTLIVEHVAKVIEGLCCARRDAAGGTVVSSFSVRCIRSWRPFCCGRPA